MGDSWVEMLIHCCDDATQKYTLGYAEERDAKSMFSFKDNVEKENIQFKGPPKGWIYTPKRRNGYYNATGPAIPTQGEIVMLKRENKGHKPSKNRYKVALTADGNNIPSDIVLKHNPGKRPNPQNEFHYVNLQPPYEGGQMSIVVASYNGDQTGSCVRARLVNGNLQKMSMYR